MRTPLLRLAPLVALALFASLLVAPAAGLVDPQDQLEEMQDRIQRQERAIEEATEKEDDLLDEIARADQRRRAAGQARLRPGQLSDARLRLEEVQAELKRKEARLATTSSCGPA